LRQACFGLRKLRPKGPLIDHVQQLALPDTRAVGERLSLEQPGDLTAYSMVSGACVWATYAL